MKMKLVVKYFDDLTTKELYELLKARILIFVLEQNRVYQDLDDKDYHSLHVFFEDNGEVVACLRAFLKEDNVVQIGRVLTLYHGNGLGGKLLKEGIAQIQNKMNPKKIYIEAQCYATGFYEREGFKICSEEFLKDGIPHVAMDLKL
ncbi:GNAT family acetyltransferase [Candidatus Arthromitus sp. SFB-mouse-NYU]|nr:GNAT family acetyltransferase [Candidatus Arthromitus sp. SFB-mouse-NYU]